MKNVLEFKLDYCECDKHAVFPAIILAAGSATRMQGVDKNFFELAGMPVIIRTVKAFAESEHIGDIVVVTREDRIAELESLLQQYGLSDNTFVVKGGSSREESALFGINALDNKYEKVIIHDGARPFVDNQIISRVCIALETNDSVSCGVKEKSTIKVINRDWLVTQALVRDNLVSLQTPQGVAVKPFIESARVNDLSKFTDDTSVVEAVGVQTQVVEGSYKNMKVTTPEDIKLAELYLQN